MIVKQKYVGWIGVRIGNQVINTSISFTANQEALAQLEEAKPNPIEAQKLLKGIRQNNPWAKDHMGVIEKYLEANDAGAM